MVRGSRTMSRESWALALGSSFAALASWTPNRGYWGCLRDLDRFGSSGVGVCWRGLRLGPRQGEVIIRYHPHIKLLQQLSDWTAQKIH